MALTELQPFNLSNSGNYQFGNVNASGNITANGNISGNYVLGNGALLTGVITSVANINNGNSNVTVIANGNITVGVAGNANVATFTGTGTNISGTLNVTGNSNVGNLGATEVVATTLSGTLTTNAQPNITSVGTLTGLTVSGNITPTANVTYDLGNSTNRFKDIYLSNSTIYLGTAEISSNANSVSISNPIGGQLVIEGNQTVYGNNIIDGNSNITVNPNANITVSVAGNANTVVFTGTGANITGTLNVTGNSNVGNLGATNVTATTLGGTLTTASQPNITSVGTLSSLTVSGNASAGNINSGNLLTANYITGTLTTSSQPNITTVGTLSSLNVGGNASAENINAGNLLTANYITGTLTTSSQSNITTVGTLGSLAVTANITAGNVNAGNLLTANFITGTLTTAAQPNITSLGTITNAVVSGNLQVNGNVVSDNVISRTGLLTLSASGADQDVDLKPTGNGTVDVWTARISNVGTPTQSTDAATKDYVDSVAQGLHVHAPCNAATTGTLATLTSGTVTYNNGSSGVGATLTTTGSYTTIDGVNIATVGTRILVKNEANTAHNGIYTYTSSTVITRATDFNTPAEMAGGDFTFVTSGSTYNDTGWVLTDPVTTVGTTAVTFAQFSGAGTYTAGTGLTLNGTQFSISNTTVTAANYGNGDRVASFTVNAQGQLTAASNVVIAANAANLTGTTLSSNILNSSLTSVGTLGNLSVSGNIGGSNLAISGNGTITGNLTVSGTTTFVNTTSLDVENPIIGIGRGPNNAPLVTNDGKDRGEQLWYYTSSEKSAFLGYDNSTANLIAASDVTIFNQVVTVNNWGNFVAGGITAQGSLSVTGNATITGNLNVTGNTNYSNVSTLNVEDPIIYMGRGANNTPLTSNDGLDRGSYMWYFNTAERAAFMGYDNSTGKLIAASNVSVSNNVVTVNDYGTLVAGNIEVQGITASGDLSAANVSGGNTVSANYVSGTLTTSAQPNITSTGTLTSLGVTGNVTAGNVYSNSGTIGASLLTGTLTTAAQPNITSVGTLTGLSVNGNITAANITANTGVFTGNGRALTNLSASNIDTGTLAQARLANSSLTINGQSISLGGSGTITANTTQTLTLGSYLTGTSFNGGTAVTAAVDATSVNTASKVVARDASGNFSAGTITATLSGAATTAGTVTTAAQPNITSVGTLTSLSVTGNANAGNIGATFGVFTNVSGNGSSLTSLTGANVTGTVANATYATSAGSATSATTAGTVTTAAQPNITSLGTLTGLTVNGSTNSYALFAGTSTTIDPSVVAGFAAGQVTESTGFSAPGIVIGSSTGQHGAIVYGSNTMYFGSENGSDNTMQTRAMLYSNARFEASTFTSTATTGTAPFTVTSTTQVANLNAATAGSATTAGTVTTAAQPNITSVGTLTSLAVTGNISGANLTGTHYGAATGLTSIPGANVTGTVANATYATSAGSATSATSATTAGTVTTAAQPNITSVGTLSGLTVSATITGSVSGSAGTASYTTGSSGGAVQSYDLRTISPSSMTASRMGFGFTAFNNNNSSPWADYFHLRSYTDASGGNDNLVVFNKSSIGMRIYQQSWGSASAYSSYKDVAWTDGTNASGTWGINISGSAGSATTATSATSATTAGTVTTAAQPNITSTGSLTNTQTSSLGVGTAASGTSGEIRATNNITAYYSDDRLKTRLGNIENALEKVCSLTGFYYEANELAQSLGYKPKREVGLSAQDMERVLPEVVSPAPIDEQYKTMHYERVSALLVEAIKEIAIEIKDIKKRLGD